MEFQRIVQVLPITKQMVLDKMGTCDQSHTSMCGNWDGCIQRMCQCIESTRRKVVGENVCTRGRIDVYLPVQKATRRREIQGIQEGNEDKVDNGSQVCPNIYNGEPTS